MSTITDAQAAAIATAVTQAVLAALNTEAPAVTEPKAPAKADNGFVEWLRETAPARAERKVTNKALAAKLDKTRKGWRGASNRESIWAAAKNGKRVPAVKA